MEVHIADGMTPEEARYAALRAMGGVDRRKEECRDARGINFIDNFVHDLRYAGRILRRSPGYTAIAVITLALGIGGIAAIFSVVNGVLLRPLPYENPERLVFVATGYTGPSGSSNSFLFKAPPAGADWPDRVQLFDGMTWVLPSAFTMPEADSPVVGAVRVAANYFSVIGARPLMGRDFVEQDAPGGAAILSYPFWRQRLGGDPNILGKALKFSEATLTVVGVMPARFRAPFFATAEFWAIAPKPSTADLWFGRLKPGFTATQAEMGVRGILKQVGQEYPASAARDVVIRELLPGTAANRRLLLILSVSVGFILLMAVINVANLMLSRTVTRHREIAIRAAIGAGRRRLVRQLLTESLLLASMGGSLGLAACYAGMRLIVRTIPQTFPRIHEIYMDPAVVAFVLLTTLLTSVGFGILPAFASSRPDLQNTLKDGARNASESRRNRWLRQALVTAEIGLATVLLIGAALTGKSFWKLINVPLGMETENVIAATLRLPQSRYRTETERTGLYGDLLERLKRYPEVESVSLARNLPVESGFRNPTLIIESSSSQSERTISWEVTPDYFRTLRMSLIDGRPFVDGEQAAVVNDTLARKYWPASNPIGKRIKLGVDTAQPWLTIVGVVRDEGLFEFGMQRRPQVFVPCAQCSILLVKVHNPSTDIGRTIRRELSALDANVLITNIQTMDESLSANYRVVDSRFRTTLFLAFAGAGLLLAFAGVYGVTSYSAAQRTQEVGIRMALGATRGNVLSMMMRQSLATLVAGMSAGLLGASAMTGLLRGYLFEVEPTDPAVFIGAPILLTLAAFAANFIPAQRASRVDPMAALHME
ncbi:MAG: ABC transporter permease [Acidobacteria bacterium]|nr:ABC transporter permease [Acidobacteriota bacterium]